MTQNKLSTPSDGEQIEKWNNLVGMFDAGAAACSNYGGLASEEYDNYRTKYLKEVKQRWLSAQGREEEILNILVESAIRTQKILEKYRK
jgi:hypothetical protein